MPLKIIDFLSILDTLHTILCTYLLYWWDWNHPHSAMLITHARYLILNFGNVANLDINMWWVDSSWWIFRLIFCLGQQTYVSSNSHFMIDALYFPNVAQIQVDVNVFSVLADLSHTMLMMGIGSYPDFSTTVCSSRMSLGCECTDVWVAFMQDDFIFVNTLVIFLGPDHDTFA